MTDLTYTPGDRVSWHVDGERREGVIQQRDTADVRVDGETLTGSKDNAVLTVLTSQGDTLHLHEADVRRVVVPY